jgi:hypothetical protein
MGRCDKRQSDPVSGCGNSPDVPLNCGPIKLILRNGLYAAVWRRQQAAHEDSPADAGIPTT